MTIDLKYCDIVRDEGRSAQNMSEDPIISKFVHILNQNCSLAGVSYDILRSIFATQDINEPFDLFLKKLIRLSINIYIYIYIQILDYLKPQSKLPNYPLHKEIFLFNSCTIVHSPIFYILTKCRIIKIRASTVDQSLYWIDLLRSACVSPYNKDVKESNPEYYSINPALQQLPFCIKKVPVFVELYSDGPKKILEISEGVIGAIRRSHENLISSLYNGIETTVNIVGAGFSIITKEPKELIYGAVTGINIKLITSGIWTQYIMTVRKLQFDVPSRNALYPTMLQTCAYTSSEPMKCDFCHSLNSDLVGNEKQAARHGFVPAIHSCALLYIYIIILIYLYINI